MKLVIRRNTALQLRRQTRERREYIYAKSLESQERQTYERKRQLKDALASGKAFPTELRKDAKKIGKDLAYDEAQEGKLSEYTNKAKFQTRF